MHVDGVNCFVCYFPWVFLVCFLVCLLFFLIFCFCFVVGLFMCLFVCSLVLFCCFSFGCIHIAPSFNCIFVLFYIADELLEKFTWLKELCLLWHIPIKSAGLFE